jgi:phosphoglycerate dehydrogenase-like enzyme
LYKFAIVSRDHEIYKRCLQSVLQPLNGAHCIHIGSEANAYVEAEADIILSEPDVARAFISKCKRLKWLQSTWAGNNVLQQHEKKDYVLTGVKGIFAAQMRDYVFAYILYFQRNIALFKQLQSEKQWQQPKVEPLSKMRLGIIGMGNIGTEIAKTAFAFSMKVSAVTSHNKPLKDVEYFKLNQLADFAKHCDYIVNLLPETSETIGVFNAKFFEAVKATAVFINAGRGSALEDEQFLISLLKQGRLRGAVLDVFKQEPLSPTHGFYTAPNLFLSNHTAAISDPEQVFAVFMQNLENFVQQKPMQFQHDFDKGY